MVFFVTKVPPQSFLLVEEKINDDWRKAMKKILQLNLDQVLWALVLLLVVISAYQVKRDQEALAANAVKYEESIRIIGNGQDETI